MTALSPEADLTPLSPKADLTPLSPILTYLEYIMKIEVIGPLIFWTMMFITAAFIKVFAFSDYSFWTQIPPDISLWAMGILFTIAASEKTYSNAKLVPRITRHTSGAGYSVDYDVTVTDNIGFTPKYLYLFLLAVPIWIINILISGFVTDSYRTTKVFTLPIVSGLSVSAFLASLIVVAALKALYEVAK